MFIDASAIVAILGREPGYEEIEKRLESAESAFFVSPLVRFEASLSLARLKTGGMAKAPPDLLLQAQAAVDALVEALDATEVTITPEIGRWAVAASAGFGKAVGYAADLNFGDCFTYACAKVLGVAVVYKGNDFAKSDLA